MTADRAALVEKAIALMDEKLSQGYLDIEDNIPPIVALIRAETLEEAARVAETCQWWESELMDGDERGPIAAAIRALKGDT